MVLIAGGAMGFLCGMLAFPSWQVAVETSQVVAGLVPYPAGNPFGVYHLKLWTIVHHLCAPLLLAGVSEVMLSKVVSGLLGMVSFQALAMVVYAFSQNSLLAIGSPLLIFVSRVAESGVRYPIHLLNTTDTYGALGLSFFVLVAGVLGSGRARLAGFLLGLAPAIHPALGSWLLLVVALCLLWDFRNLRQEWRPSLRFFVAGALVTAVSLLVQLSMMRGLPEVDSAQASRYLSTFVGFWDAHRGSIDFRNGDVILNMCAAAVAITWLAAFRNDLPRPSLFLLRFVVVCAALGWVSVLVSTIPPERVPSTLLILMPTRLLNANVLLFPAFLLGLLGAYRRVKLVSLLAIAVFAGLLLSQRSMLWDAVGQQSLPRVRPFWMLAGAAAALIAVVARGRSSDRLPDRPEPAWEPGTMPPHGAVTRYSIIVIVVVSAAIVWRTAAPELADFRDRTNDDFFAQVASESNGLLLTGGQLHLVQLRTRRPVLLDGGGLDMLPYALEAAPEMDRILRDAYDIDLFNPPQEARAQAVIPNEVNRVMWERHSADTWRAIALAFDLTQVVTPSGWTLQLPITAQNESLRLYRIPK